MSEMITCDFVLVRYVPDVVRGEFVNIGVILRASSSAVQIRKTLVRFTDDWGRVLCIDGGADLNLLEGLEDEMTSRLRSEEAMGREGVSFKPIVDQFLNTCSLFVQLSDPKVCLTDDLENELHRLMRMYVEDGGASRPRRVRGHHDLVYSAMRREFRRQDVWSLMLKNIDTSRYTRPGNPLKIDCGYRHGGTVRLFHGVSLRSGPSSAKLLARSAASIAEGVERVESATLLLTAVVEPFQSVASPKSKPDVAERYKYLVDIMQREGIRVVATDSLTEIGLAVRQELLARKLDPVSPYD